MIKKIITDKKQLSIPCKEATDFDNIVTDLIDTAKNTYCSGLAANQIGYNQRVVLVKVKDALLIMVNPKITLRFDGIKSMYEECLSLPEIITKKRRHKKIKVSFFSPITNTKFKKFGFNGFTARIIQHEIDHLNGILI